jgi:hypothetical protein
MIGRRSSIGIALLCVFAFCAFAAQSAMAQKGTSATNTTAVTCVEGKGNLDFSDAHCDKKVPNGTGKYGHVAIKNGETTEIEVTNAATKDKVTIVEGKEVVHPTADATTSLLKATVGGVKSEISCEVTTTTGAAKASWIENVESEGKHTVKGTVNVRFEKCTVIKPLNCKILEPIVTVANFVGVENLKPGGNEMGVEFTGENAKGNFASLTFDKDEKCGLKNITFEVAGSAIATGKTATQSEKHSGATSVYTPNKEVEPKEAEEMQTLKVGAAPAYFTGTFTTKMSGGGNPITMTTTT